MRSGGWGEGDQKILTEKVTLPQSKAQWLLTAQSNEYPVLTLYSKPNMSSADPS